MRRLLRAPLFCVTAAAMLLGLAALAFAPRRTFSELENRTLAAWEPAAWLASAVPAEKIETYVSDHFPLRDAFVRADATLAALSGGVLQDGVLVCGGALIEEPQAAATRTALDSVDALARMAETLELPATLVLIPTSAAALEDALPPLYEPGDQRAVLGTLYARAQAGGLQALTAPLSRPGDYYRTDHHLTADGARAVYETLAGAWGFEPEPGERFEAEGFLGSYYARAPVLTVKPETMTVDLPRGLSLTLDGVARDSLIDREALGRRGKYAAVLGETYAHATLTGGAGEESLLIVGDSYANALAPSLAKHFKRVDVIDPRYFTGDLERTAREAGSGRMLALFGLNTFSTNRALPLLGAQWEE